MLKLYNKLFNNLFLLACIFFWNASSGQFSNIPGTPLIKNFSGEDMRNSPSIFDISQSKDGIMYFATPSGLVEYDGVRWVSYREGLKSDLRSVLYKDDQHIYTGGHGGFGYWSKNEKGVLDYTSLFFKLPEKQAPLLPVFSRIKTLNGKILFQTFQQIFIYDADTKKLDTINATKGFNLLFESKGRAFIQDVGIGLFEIKGKELVLIEGTNNNQLDIVNVFVKDDRKLLLVTKNNGFWEWSNNTISKKQWEINAVIEKNLANDVQEYQNKKLVIGTVRKGIYVVSEDGKILFHQEKSNGLLENSVKKVFKDLNNNLWIGTENGLSYLQINSNTNYLLDVVGEFGTVYASFLKDSLLYLGTNQGLFMKNIEIPNSDTKLINKTAGQIWQIEKLEDDILVCSDEGISLLENNKLKLIHKEAGAWIFKKHPKLDNILYVGFYSGIGVFKRENNTWKFVRKWENYGESSRFIEFDKYGHLWVTHPVKGYYRMVLSDDGLDLNEYEFYGIDNDFVDTYAYFCMIDGDLVFYNPKGYFSYDPIDNTFIPQKYAAELFKDVKDINSIAQYEDVFWYSTPNSLGYMIRNKNNFSNIRKPFYSIRNKHLNDFNKFVKINKTVFAIGINNGIIFHKINNLEQQITKIPPTIRSIKLISTKDTILASINSKAILEIPYNNNFLKIALAMPQTTLVNYNQIQYKLNGLNDNWTNLDHLSDLNFPGLAPGNYTLELRSVSDDNSISDTINRSFFIKPPWYRTNLAFAIYVLLLIVINMLYRTYFKRKSQKQIEILKQLELEKRKSEEEKFNSEKLKVDKEILTLKEENLNLEIKKKNSELATSTLNNIKKNELLTSLIEDLNKIDEELINSSLHPSIKKVLKKININLTDKEDWLTFELHFRNVHSDFFEKLREKHPDLSSNEIKLSAYLKLNLSSKEIASILNISIKSVDQGRWRLRKKMDLSKDASLVNYIQSL
uniref:triple tyrosine motif-containing protein n=2 Tax=Flavobacterium sp. TaxID=239 RepID=UPI00404B3FFA